MPLTEQDLQTLCRDLAAGKPLPDPVMEPERAALTRTMRETMMLIGGFRSLLGTADQAGIQKVSEANWVPYQGPLGGKGWKNPQTGRVYYGDQQPGAGERGVDPQDVAATVQAVTKPASTSAPVTLPPPGQTPLQQATVAAAQAFTGPQGGRGTKDPATGQITYTADAGQPQPASDLTGLFSDQEKALPGPEDVKQPASDQQALYASAVKAKETFDSTLDHGKGVDKAIGGRAVRPASAEEFQAALDGPGPVVILAPLKGEKRAAEKVQAKYGGDWSKLQDVVRATIAVDSIDQIPLAIKSLRAEMPKGGWAFAVAPVDRMSNPLPSGYRDIQLKLKGPDGHIAELQINLKGMIKAKEGHGHKLYEQHRSLVAAVKAQNRQPTAQETSQLQSLEQQMKQLFDNAWAAAR